MIFDSKSKIFQGLNCSRAKAFVIFNNHQVWVPLYKPDCLALMRKEIVLDGAKLELRFQCLEKRQKASFECEKNVPSTRFPFLPDVYFRIGKRY